MADSGNIHEPACVVNSTDDSVLSDSEAPEAQGTDQHSSAGRAGSRGQSLDPTEDPLGNRSGQALQFPPG